MRLYFGMYEPGEEGSFKSWPSRMRSDDDVHNIVVHAFQVGEMIISVEICQLLMIME